ncbi:SRPBCC family protein [Streptomyces sp. SAJ15]|uniref:SRPBCC family protein n=1 Tax=Streptomyces sp. SAJ15 TaxID=2011095 RepID=UPI0021B2266F|nr:SRPBCC family protein [Streptomyces sp. SAJ15]
MAIRHRLVHRSPEQVWAVLADGSRYGDWVIGPSQSSQVDEEWPRLGSRIEYVVALGPWTLTGETIVRHCEPMRELELEAVSGWLGTARIAMEIRAWGEETLVILDEHPLRGTGGRLHNVALDAVLQLRHRSMLARFAEVVESAGSGGREGPDGRAGQNGRTPSRP